MGVIGHVEILDCLHEIGVNIEFDNSPLYLKDIIGDSLLFISFIIELETKYNFEMPDEYLLIEELETVDDLCNIINNIINEGE